MYSQPLATKNMQTRAPRPLGVTITLGACPRCRGAVVDYHHLMADHPLCITCGWRQPDITADVQQEVGAYLGKPFIGNRHAYGPDFLARSRAGHEAEEEGLHQPEIRPRVQQMASAGS